MSLPRRVRAAAIPFVAAPFVAAVGMLTPVAAVAAQSAPVGCTGTPSATWINVVLEGLRSNKGQAAITLYADNSRKFLAKGGALVVGRTPAHQGTLRTCIFVPGPGTYALAIYHDENGNDSFDRTTFAPLEGFGFSNNPTTLAGLPMFRSVRLAIPRTNLTTRIQMKYP